MQYTLSLRISMMSKKVVKQAFVNLSVYKRHEVPYVLILTHGVRLIFFVMCGDAQCYLVSIEDGDGIGK